MDPVLASALILKLGQAVALPLIIDAAKGDAIALAEARRIVKEPLAYFEEKDNG